ncbi:GPI biosynthesis protein family Pig-F-domain-containing protein [Butyriboletus roseoflavus]|nr:GPI biosynthesis protein family Pig-F-domain-containing protein [Butyriboletus roseoflavus]
MPARTAKPPTTSKATSVKSGETAPAPLDPFPFAQYASVLGVHLILVGFIALYLPQTTRLFAPLAVRKADRPQTEFIEMLTGDPSLTLGWIFAGLALLQVWWASWVRKWSFEQTARGTEVEMKLDRVRFDSLRFTRFKDAIVFTLFAALATYVVIVMLGAPLTTHILQTALLAFVIAILTAFTPAFVLGLPSFASDTPSMINRLTWTRLFVELSPRNAIECGMIYPAVGTFVGGWLGAIPIALDWDRPWQAWPLTPLFGSIGGYIIGALFGFTFSMARWVATEHIQSQPSKPKSS